MTNRSTSVTIGRCTSEILPVDAGKPQGSPISPILFLFFNAPRIEECANPGLATNIKALEAEAGVIHLDIYLDQAVPRSRDAQKCQEVISLAKKKIRLKLRNKSGRRSRPGDTLLSIKNAWGEGCYEKRAQHFGRRSPAKGSGSVIKEFYRQGGKEKVEESMGTLFEYSA